MMLLMIVFIIFFTVNKLQVAFFEQQIEYLSNIHLQKKQHTLLTSNMQKHTHNHSFNTVLDYCDFLYQV